MALPQFGSMQKFYTSGGEMVELPSMISTGQNATHTAQQQQWGATIGDARTEYTNLPDAVKRSMDETSYITKRLSGQSSQQASGGALTGIGGSATASSTGAGGAGGSGIPSSLQGIYGEYQKAYDEARAANETRYKEIKGEYDSRYGRAMDYIDQISDQAQQDISERWRQREASAMQSLTDRGMTGTTIPQTMGMGYQRMEDAEQRRLSDQTLRERLEYDSGLTKDKLDFMERREDTYPDFGMLAQLARDAGRGQAGGMNFSFGGGSGFRRRGGYDRTGRSTGLLEGIRETETVRDPRTGREVQRQRGGSLINQPAAQRRYADPVGGELDAFFGDLDQRQQMIQGSGYQSWSAPPEQTSAQEGYNPYGYVYSGSARNKSTAMY